MACKNKQWICLAGILCVTAGPAFSQEAEGPAAARRALEAMDAAMAEAGTDAAAEEPDPGAAEPSPEELVGGENIIEQTEEGFRILQRLNWVGDEFAGRYEVIIEVLEEGGAYREVLRQSTVEPSIEVSLSPGKYRYRVLVYNLLGQVDYEMNWAVLDVIRAMPPALTRLNPENFLIDKAEQGEVTLSGRNLIAESEVFLVLIDDARGRTAVVTPLAWLPDPSGERARIVLDKTKLLPGRYEVHVRNPGNLEVSLDTLKVAYYRLLDVNLMAAYAVMTPVYGKVFSLVNGRVYPVGALMRFSINPMGRKNIAFELEPFFFTSWPSLFSEEADAIGSFNSPLSFTGFKAYGLYRAPFAGDRMTFNLRFGGGILLMNINNYVDITSVGYDPKGGMSLVPLIGGGISFQFFVTKSLFIEAGASFTHGIIKTDDDGSSGDDDDTDLMPGYIDPFLGVGWRF
jgi:hypothetical protein